MPIAPLQPRKKCTFQRKQCPHNLWVYSCIQCEDARPCEHEQQRSSCTVCRGGIYCEHSKVRSRCIQCYGFEIRRESCRKCTLNPVCSHNEQRKPMCFDHWNGLKEKRFCKQCGGTGLCTSCQLYTVKRTNTLCATCGIPGWQGKKKEKAVGLKLLEWAHQDEIPLFTCADKALPASGTLYRMDFYYDLGSFFLSVECDESEHALMGYPPRCELVRMYRLRNGLGIPAIFVWWNPDAFKIDGVAERVPLTQRHELLKETVQHYIKEGPGSNFLVLVTICYSQPAKTMHGEALPYVTMQLFQTELDYETFVSNVYPHECKGRTLGTP